MRHYFGLNEYQLRQQKKEEAVFYDPERLINAHLVLCGMSGTGKTHQSVLLMNAAAATGNI